MSERGEQCTINQSRRNFLKQSGVLTAGLAIGFHWPQVMAAPEGGAGVAEGEFEPNAWVSVLPDNTVRIVIEKYDSGTGTHTALATCVCEELHTDLSQVQVDFPDEPFLETYLHPWWHVWSTGGSTSIRLNYERMRQAGAIARTMLVAAAAEKWGVPPDSCTAENRRITHTASGRSVRFGDVATAAAQLPIPEQVKLKKPSEFKYIGKIPGKLKALEKATGRFQYSIDLTLPGMLVASIERAPLIGDRVQSVDASAALKVPGVRKVITVPARPDILGGNEEGVAVLADDFWTAQQGRKALKVKWRNDSKLAAFDSDNLAAVQAAWLDSDESEFVRTITVGDADAQWAQADTVMQADYHMPFKAQNPLEPMCITAQVKDNQLTFWGGIQVPSWALEAAREVAEVPTENITIHNRVAGGSFGARENKYWLLEVTYLAKQTGQPVKLLNSREDEMRGLYYHSPTFHRLRGAVDAQGNMTTLQLRAVSPRSPEQWEPGYNERPDHMDYSTTEAIRKDGFAYRFDNMDLGWVPHETGVPTGWYRAVSFIPNVFAVESFMDEMAHAAGRDPLAFRLAHLRDRPRHAAVLRAAAERAGWGKELPAGTALGIATDQGYGTFIAVVARVEETEQGVAVSHLTCVADCGLAVSRKGVEEQLYGGLMWGMGHTLHDKLDIKNGQVVQSNFNNYLVPRMSEMPAVDIEVLEGDRESPTGIGELSNPLVPPAVANAVFQLIGERQRTTPLSLNRA